MKDQQIDELLLKFLDEKASPDEIRFLKEWLLADSSNLNVFRKEYEGHQKLRYLLFRKDIDVDGAWESLNERIETDLPKRKKYLTLNWLNSSVMKVAASVALLAAVYLGGIYSAGNRDRQEADLIQFYSPSGEKSRIVLADGTVVWLNSQSQLEYSASNARSVKLTGEAFFDVTPNEELPFLVETGAGMKVKVLGTRFNVSAYPGDRKVETTLERGKVEVFHHRVKESVCLNPGEQFLFDEKEAKAVVKKVDTELFTLWKENTLKFDNTPFEDVVKKIERWYGIEIILDPELKNSERFTMTLKTESMRELLKMLQLTVKMDYKIDGEKVYIIKK